MNEQPIWVDYTNHRGERRWRHIEPRKVYWGNTKWHPAPQWLLHAWDVEKMCDRDYALLGIHAVSSVAPAALSAQQAEPVANVYRDRFGEVRIGWWNEFVERPPVGTKLYTHPAPSVSVPDGWKLVPAEPTEAMKIARDHAGFWCGDKYRAMLDAAPTTCAELSTQAPWPGPGALASKTTLPVEIHGKVYDVPIPVQVYISALRMQQDASPASAEDMEWPEGGEGALL